MIDEASFQQHTRQFPALGQLEPKLRELARDELTPDEQIIHASNVSVSGVPGCAWISDSRVMVIWKMKLFIFFKFPTMQEFHRAQLTRIEPQGTSLFLRAEAGDGEQDWEENTLTFASEQECQQFAKVLSA